MKKFTRSCKRFHCEGDGWKRFQSILLDKKNWCKRLHWYIFYVKTFTFIYITFNLKVKLVNIIYFIGSKLKTFALHDENGFKIRRAMKTFSFLWKAAAKFSENVFMKKKQQDESAFIKKEKRQRSSATFTYIQM